MSHLVENNMTNPDFFENGKFIRWAEYSVGIVLFVIGILLYLQASGYQIGWNILTREWIIYSSEQYQYSIQYPGHWRLYTSGDKGWHGGLRPYQRLISLRLEKILLP